MKERTDIKDVFAKANRAEYVTAAICVQSLKDVKEYVEKDFLGEEKDFEIDVDRYREHPDCEKLVCFVYDPEGKIGNPNGIMDDLNTRHKGFVTVVIQPDM